jgi:hypothetical protein
MRSFSEGPINLVTSPRLALILALLVPYLAVTATSQILGMGKQNFGLSKKTIVLHRKLPAMVHLTGSTFAVQSVSHDGTQAEVSQVLTDILESTLLKNDKNLTPDKTAPAITITCTITHYETPPPRPFIRQESSYQGGKVVDVNVSYNHYSGAVDVAYRAAQRNGSILDSDNLSAKYAQDFQQGTNQAASKPGSITDDVQFWKRKKPAKEDEQQSLPPTTAELRQDLLQRIAFQVAARLVNTDEPVEIYLAKGKLDDANKLAEAGLWTRDLETLETMTPFPNPQDEAYRVYNIGVANEALAYQTDDHAAAKKFLEEAAINYGKAIDDKPSEKYFLEPQNRIESAIAYYKKLEDRELTEKNSNPPSKTSDQVRTAERSDGSKPPLTPASSKEGDPLTNEKIVEMFKSGVDEDSILAVIHNAPLIKFDVSPDGLIAMAKDGIKGKIPAAMRERTRAQKIVPAKTLVK